MLVALVIASFITTCSIDGSVQTPYTEVLNEANSASTDPSTKGSNATQTGNNAPAGNANPAAGAHPHPGGANPAAGGNPQAAGANAQPAGAHPHVNGANPQAGPNPQAAGANVPAGANLQAAGVNAPADVNPQAADANLPVRPDPQAPAADLPAGAKPPAVGADPSAGGGQGAGKVGAEVTQRGLTAESGSKKRGNEGEGRGKWAMRWSALLWAIACCAAGSLIGFIFGIPRSLSSDTARHTVPGQSNGLDSSKGKAATSIEAVHADVTKKEQPDEAMQQINNNLAAAKEKASRLSAAAADHPENADARKSADDAKQELADLEKRKDDAEKNAGKNSGALKIGQQQQQADRPDAPAIQSRTVASGNIPALHGPSTAVNTNLEQISDWLTKIIVGVSLVNSDKIGGAMLSTAKVMANSLGSGPDKVSVALAILIFFGMTGLLGGYLLTRLFLQRAFESVGSSK